MNDRTYSQENVEVNGRRGQRHCQIIIDDCPYCGKTHIHAERNDDNFIRESDCKPGGQYKIIMPERRLP